MIELIGKYTTAKVFTDYVDPNAVSQIIELCSQPLSAGAKVRIMPDVHSGASSTVGTTMTVTDKIIPSVVGSDIGCGMEVAILDIKAPDFRSLDNAIREKVPSGSAIRKVPLSKAKGLSLNELKCASHIDISRAEKSLGTLGGGNHFIELDVMDDGKYCLVVHSGSRSLGLDVARYYQNLAYATLNGTTDADLEALSLRLKAEGKKDVKKEVKKYKNVKFTDVPKHLAYLEGKLFDDYVHDMKLTQEYARQNRLTMIEEITSALGWNITDSFTTVHNYYDTENKIIRKGSISAQKGERCLIPLNMRDGSLICIGKGNQDWNCSAPHGAGRKMSRSTAKQTLTLEGYLEEMKGIYSTSIGYSTLDESPSAYKSADEIIDNIAETVDIVELIRPVYNFKASE